MLEVLGIVAFLLLMLASIGLHEMGHLIPAKKFGVRVPEYMVGFGPTIFSRRIGETIYGIKLLPLGGYIRMIGMLPPPADSPEGTARSLTTGRAGALIHSARQQSLEEITPADNNRVFYKLPPWKRVVIMMGGPLMNLLLATLLFSFLIAGIGLSKPTLQIDRVMPCLPASSAPFGQSSTTGECILGPSAATTAGLIAGDTLLSIDGQKPTSWEEFNRWIQQAGGNTVEIQILREGEVLTNTIALPLVERPALNREGNTSGQVQQVGYLGVQPAIEYERQPITAVPTFMFDMVKRAGAGLLTLPIRLYELLTETLLGGGERSVDSPVSVVGASRIGGEVVASDEPAESKILMFLGLAASVNLFLFMFNLLPILPLDGGHVAGALYESVKRRISRIRGRPDPGPVDTARMLPIAYAMAVVLVAVGSIVIIADLIRPLSIS